ncbi:acyl-ACP--UDP-N-acetylglucosamine O-acyltransferase [Pelagibacterium luteolum]|uniref:Acyl-[acyl-carrier-protein]--UDP-N-acetylglucosamine O-acyltransferase n=1 Tax=Pelagibacterium luteolum TaxID=440168 RepID=A0A1G7X1C1_9HYPH|nr:acyl-ACP--UDP-N-acetylglucosamine O-acyltransferase [Pelagibacterium luteolum]SDG77969.1 acyl-[acyl-carrier-protein]--UDP-N-acetylglucosamine O-acyltransferase [Pelagibacterium luteolum]
MTTTIHPTAIVSEAAKIGENVSVGPYCIVGDDVVLGDGVSLISHVSIDGRTTVGPRTKIYPFSSIGHPPQDLKFEGEHSTVNIGSDCTLREYVTINPGTSGGGMETRVGDHCLLMVGVHIAHDCRVGNHVVMANQASLAGHCIVDDYVRFGGICGVHQFVRIGAHAFVGAMSFVENDVIPYGSVLGNRAYLGGLNLVGLKRRKFDRESIHALRAAYRMIFSNEGTLRERIEDAAEIFKGEKLVEEVINFIRKPSERALCMPRNGVETSE